MLTAAELKSLLGARGLRLTKRLGQHHLIDPAAIRRVVAQCEPLARAVVVEIGPGLGALTEPIAERAERVIAVEIDRGVAAVLGERLRGRSNVDVHCADILQFPWSTVPHAVVIGAIPYSITSPILVALCEAATVDRAVLIMQDEVAQRLAARPGTKAYGRLSVLVQYSWDVSLGFAVPRGAFFPPPGVESRCVELSRRSRPAVEVADEPLFFEVVKAAFSQRRKTLANALTTLPEGRRLPRTELQALLASAGLPGSVRGEALSLEQFASLANALGARAAR